MTLNKRLFFYVFAFSIFFLFSGQATADTISATVEKAAILDKIVLHFKQLHTGWFNIIVSYTWKLFWGLAAVDFAWSTITWVLDRKEIGEICTALVRKIMVLGFFALLLKMANSWIPAIIESFTQIGKSACGTSCGTLSPDGIFIFGLNIAGDLYAQTLELGMGDIMIMILPISIIVLLIVIAFSVVAGQLLITLIESYIAIGAGVIMLGFGGSRWTSDMASSYLKFAVGTGMKVMLVYLIMGAGISIFDSMIELLQATAPRGLLFGALILAAEALVFVFLSWNIPSLAAAMLSGSPSQSLGGFMAAATTAGAAIAGGAGLAASLGTGGAAQSMGVGKALASGYSNARSSGSGVMSSAMQSVPKAIHSGFQSSQIGKNVSDSVSKTIGGRAATNMDSKSASESNTTSTPSSPEVEGSASQATEASASTSTSSSRNNAPKPSSASSSAGSSSLGNASGSKLTNSSGGWSPNQGGQAQQSAKEKRVMSDVIRDLQKFVPPDSAQVQTPGINLSHGHGSGKEE